VTPGEPPRLGVVVVNYASHELLETLLLPLGRHHVVVADSFSSVREQRALQGLAARHGWQLALLADNPGFGSAANEGARLAVAAGCDVLLLLNPDAEATPEVVEALAGQVRAEPDVVVSPRIVRPDGRVWFRGGDLDLRRGMTSSSEHPVEPWLTATVLAVNASTWTAVGGFDPDYFMYWEDIDLSFRLRRAGARLVVRQDLTAVHAAGGTQETSGRTKSPLYYRGNCRGRLVFAAKHLSTSQQLRWLVGSPVYGRDVLYRGGRRQLLHPRRTVLPAAAGTLAGAWHVVRAITSGRQATTTAVGGPSGHG